jgi:hypothetical protein
VHSHSRPEVLRAKRRYGLFYGIVMGLAFATATWGMDAYLLSQAHALQPWLKLIVGGLICGLAGGIAGWLVMRLENSFLSLVIWLAAASVFAWMTVALPLQIIPRLLSLLDPDLSKLLSYVYYEDMAARFGVAYVWVGIFVSIGGLLELPMGEPAAFSTSIMGKIAPALVCITLMYISGLIVDGLNNEPLRSAVVAMNETIQFAADHQNEVIDPAVSREKHLASLSTVSDLITQPRELIVGQFDRNLEQIHILVRFENQWVDCLAVYNQPLNCERVTP